MIRRHLFLVLFVLFLSQRTLNAIEATQPSHRIEQLLHGWKILVDDRLLNEPNAILGTNALKFLDSKLADICQVVPVKQLESLKRVTIVLDLNCGKLQSMQYHPSAHWLKENGYPMELEKCVHIPIAADLPTVRNINEQPWVILHELAHAYHDQVLDFENPRIKDVQSRYKESGRGDATLLFNGQRVKHYALTNQMEFFAEMTEAYFGSNDFFPFNRAELQETELETYELMTKIWNSDK